MNKEASNNWELLPATEKNNYIEFHELAYKEDLRHSEKNIIDFPRWSIISGYYAMHDITKLFLAEKFNIKVSSPDIHSKTLDILEQAIIDKKLKEKLLGLLREAKSTYYNVERLKERALPILLRREKQERGKSQYYTQDFNIKTNINAQKSSYFLDEIVKPYILLIWGLLK